MNNAEEINQNNKESIAIREINEELDDKELCSKNIRELVIKKSRNLKKIHKKLKKNILVDMLYAKIHRATITDSNINYVGSISIDSYLLEKCGMMEGMKVEILNINNGERFQTYIISAKRNSGTICINGAAARKVQKGDIVIILAYMQMPIKYANRVKPSIIFVDSNNQIKKKEK